MNFSNPIPATPSSWRLVFAAQDTTFGQEEQSARKPVKTE